MSDLLVLDLSQQGRPSPLRRATIKALGESLTGESPRCSCVVLRGSQEAFGYGADLRFLSQAEPVDVRDYFLSVEDLRVRIERLHVPTLAVIEGPAYGASADLALACDLRIGSPSASFRFPGGRFGLVLGSGRLASMVGSSRAMDFQMTGREISSSEALAAGLLSELVPSEEMSARVGDCISNLRGIPGGFVQLLRSAIAGVSAGSDPKAFLEASLTDVDSVSDRIRAYARSVLPPKRDELG